MSDEVRSGASQPRAAATGVATGPPRFGARRTLAALAALASSRVRRQLDRRLRERIMLAVSVVNGCRYCAWSHARAALLAGLPREEIRGLLDARLAAAPEADWPMLLYAQHWAERRGCPDPAARAALIERGGAALVDAVDDVLVAISFGNRLGIGLGRLLGQRPRPARLR